MKKKLTLFVLFFIGILNAQSPNWNWAKSAVSSSSNFPKKTLTDSQGNAYTLGKFYSEISFDNTTLNANNNPMYLVKNDSNGNFIWAKKFESHLNYYINIFDIDNNNNLIIGGYIQLVNGTGSINYNDEQTINLSTNSISTGNEYFFLTRINNYGALDWIKTNIGHSSPLCGTLDNQNSTYIFGEYNSYVEFDAVHLQNNFKDFFLIKNDNAGNTLWGKSFGRYLGGTLYQLRCINNQYLLLIGYTSSETFQYDNNIIQMGNPDTRKLIALKTDLNGNFISFNYIPNVPPQDDYNNQNLIDEFGNIYLFGNLSYPTITFGNTTLNRVGAEDLYLAKYSSDAQLIWAHNYGNVNAGLYFDNLYSHNNNLYLATDYYSTNSTNITLNNSTFNVNGMFTTLIIKLDSNGNYIWLKNAVGTDNTMGNSPSSISVDTNDKIIISGQYRCQNILFDNFHLLNTNNSDNDERSFFAQLVDSNLSTAENNLNASTVVYPNPVSTFLNIKSDSEIAGKEYSIIDVSGRITDKGIINSETSTIETGNLKSGMYFIKIENNSPIKFIKQ